MRRAKIKKLNNQGSTFVMAIIVITLVTMLAVSILMASAYNISMKNIDRNYKDTFYTAETIMDEVCAGTGVETLKQLGVAYSEVLTTLVDQNSPGYNFMINNNDANNKLKTIFIESMLKVITADTLHFDGDSQYVISDANDSTSRNRAKAYLSSFISGYDPNMAEILSVGNIEAYKDAGTTLGRSYMIIIRDVCIKYREDKNGEIYFSNVTTDFEIHYPNMNIDFTATNTLDDFIKYVLIANNKINIGANGTGVNVTTNASIYAGYQIDIKGGYGKQSSLKALGNIGRINVVCGGNSGESDILSGTINLKGSQNHKAIFETQNADIWCTNIRTEVNDTNGKDASAGATIVLGNDTNAYVKDDLSIEGQNSEVTISGTDKNHAPSYYGYSYDGSGHHADSSAIIINGKRAKLTVNVNELLLSGRSYIEVGNEYQMTGEALSFRGNQELYLVPSVYLGKNYGVPVSNPMSVNTWNALVAAANSTAGNKNAVKICDMTGFFAWDDGYVNTTTPYIDRKVNNELVYVYINLNKANIADYIKRIVAGGSDTDINNLNKIMKQYTNNLFEMGVSGIDVGVTVSTSNYYTNAVVLQTNYSTLLGGNNTEMENWSPSASDKNNNITNKTVIALNSLDLGNRYTIYSHLLADIPWKDESTGNKYIVNNIDSALWQKKDYWANGGEITSSVFVNIVDTALLAAKGYNDGIGGSRTFTYNNKNYIKIATTVTDYTIPAGVQGGIILCSGNVTVSQDFEGMILAGGTINVLDGVTLTNNSDDVRKLIRDEIYNKEAFDDAGYTPDVAFKNYFYAFKQAASQEGSGEAIKIENVNYKDMVKTNNWRKYEVNNN